MYSDVPVTAIEGDANEALPSRASRTSAATSVAVPSTTSVVQALATQILNQHTTQYWTGEGFGSAQANATDMARILANAGLTDINQFGMRNVTTTYDDGEGGTWDSTSSQYYNKVTGQVIDPGYSRAGGNVWSGTFAGAGSTNYDVQFDANGNNPIFYTQYGGSTSDLGSVMPLINIALMATGAGSIVGGLLTDLAGATLSNAATAAIGNAAIGGTIAAATGGNVLTSAALSGAAGYYGTQLDTTLNTNPTTAPLGTTVNSAITGGVVGGATSLLTGGNLTSGVLTGALTGAAGQIGADALAAKPVTTPEPTPAVTAPETPATPEIPTTSSLLTELTPTVPTPAETPSTSDTVNVTAPRTSDVVTPAPVVTQPPTPTTATSSMVLPPAAPEQQPQPKQDTVEVTAPTDTTTDTSAVLGFPTAPEVTPTPQPEPTPPKQDTVEVTAPKDTTTDQGTVVVTAPKDTTTDQGTVEVTAPKDATTDTPPEVVDATDTPHHDGTGTPASGVTPGVVVTNNTPSTADILASITRATPSDYLHAPNYANNPNELDAAANDLLKRMNGGRTSTLLTGGRGEDESKLSTSKILLGR